MERVMVKGLMKEKKVLVMGEPYLLNKRVE
jgi:hypothetical protein